MACLLPLSRGSAKYGNGEIASCNYVARAHGIRNGMWMQRAKELCSYLIAMPYEFHEYERAAEEMHRVGVFATTPHMMGVSVDECFADLTACADPGIRHAASSELQSSRRRAARLPSALGRIACWRVWRPSAQSPTANSA